MQSIQSLGGQARALSLTPEQRSDIASKAGKARWLGKQCKPSPNQKDYACECALCTRGRRFYHNTARLPKGEREWMRAFYNTVLDTECELEMQLAAKPHD